MQIPGEALLGKLWETLTDKAIGNLLKPWQIRREGRASLDLKREELLVLAQAERDAEAIRRGAMSFPGHSVAEQRLLLANSQAQSPMLPTAAGIPETGADQTILDVTSRAAQADALRREVNVAKAILHAESALESDTDRPADTTPSDDWMYRWRDYAASVSSEELQLLWGRVLAGEVKAPGAFSVRFLNFLHNLDRNEAQLIASAMPLVVQDFICSEPKEHLERVGLSFANLLVLQELDLVTGVEGLGLSKQFASAPGEQFRVLIRCHELALGFTAEEGVRDLQIPAYVVTSLGRQLARLGNFQADRAYLQAVGEAIKKKGFKVELGAPMNLANGGVGLTNPQTL